RRLLLQLWVRPVQTTSCPKGLDKPRITRILIREIRVIRGLIRLLPMPPLLLSSSRQIAWPPRRSLHEKRARPARRAFRLRLHWMYTVLRLLLDRLPPPATLRLP